eukprot:scaffold11.g3863.t1
MDPDRPVDPATDAIIKAALREEEAEKKARKAHKQQEARDKKAARKGKTLQQIENEEGGPIKESQARWGGQRQRSLCPSPFPRARHPGGLAPPRRRRTPGRLPTARAGRRRAVEDVEAVEEELGEEEEGEEEGGVKLEAFNLKARIDKINANLLLFEERERGYFDEAGNYVEREDKEEAEATDAWLQSAEATQIARLQFRASQLLQPDETVTAGLKRLGALGRRPAKRVRAAPAPAPAPAQGERQQKGAGAGAGAEEAQRQFDELTEVASQLMDAGETDVYTQTKARGGGKQGVEGRREYFQRAAAVYIDLPGPSSIFDAGPSKAAYEAADEDMFASEEDEKEKEKEKEEKEKKAPGQEAAGDGGAAGGAAGAPAGPPPGGAATAAAAEDTTDYGSWPIKELRRFLTERGVDPSSIVEKGDLVARAPAGYAYDPSTGMWYSGDAGMYWDPKSGGFYSQGCWYAWDAGEQRFVEWGPQAAA